MMLHSFTVDRLFTFINIDEISKVLYYELKIGSSLLVELDKNTLVVRSWKI